MFSVIMPPSCYCMCTDFYPARKRNTFPLLFLLGCLPLIHRWTTRMELLGSSVLVQSEIRRDASEQHAVVNLDFNLILVLRFINMLARVSCTHAANSHYPNASLGLKHTHCLCWNESDSFHFCADKKGLCCVSEWACGE